MPRFGRGEQDYGDTALPVPSVELHEQIGDRAPARTILVSVAPGIMLHPWDAHVCLTNMKPIQILMDQELLRELDREAKRRHSDRSKVIRVALSSFLADSRRRALEERHRRGYQKLGQGAREIEEWEGIQEWPEK